MKREDLVAWQRDYAAAPRVWAIESYCEGEREIGNVYESEAAAQIELDWHAQHKTYGVRHKAIRMVLHSLDLSQRRWLR